MSDPIDRQVAIDILMKEWKTYKDYPYVSHVRHGLEIAIAILENKVPSAQPEIVRCRECKRWNTVLDRNKAEYGICQNRSHLDTTKKDFFCADGERRSENDGN